MKYICDGDYDNASEWEYENNVAYDSARVSWLIALVSIFTLHLFRL